MLPTLEFILNNSVHSSLGVTPNAMLYGYLTPNRFDFPSLIAAADVSTIEKGKAKDFVKRLQDQLVLLRNTAERAQSIATAHQDSRYNKQLPTEYKPGDLVLLKHTHDEKVAKLASLSLGPFKVIDCPAYQTYVIQYLYDPMRTQTVHHMRLIPFLVREDVPLERLTELAEMDSGEYIVECVRNHQGFNKKNVKFLIHWRGYSEDSDTWEPWNHVEGNEKIAEYIRANPELLHLLNSKERQVLH